MNFHSLTLNQSAEAPKSVSATKVVREILLPFNKKIAQPIVLTVFVRTVRQYFKTIKKGKERQKE